MTLSRATMPCVVALSGEVNEPRRPTMAGIIASKRRNIEVVDTDALRLEAGELGASGSKTRVLGLASASRRAAGLIVEDDGSGAAWLAEQLLSTGVI